MTLSANDRLDLINVFLRVAEVGQVSQAARALDLPAGTLSVSKGYELSVRREGDGAHLPGWPYLLEPAVRIGW